MQNILVAGGAGFIGSNLVRYLIEKHPQYRLIVFDKLTYAGNLDNLQGVGQKRYAFVQGDITDAARVEAAICQYEIDALINLAAESHVDRAILDPMTCMRTNKCGTQVLLEAVKKYDLRAHFVTTAQGWAEEESGDKTNGAGLLNPYTAMKKNGDDLIRTYMAEHGILATCTRSVNNIGPYQYPEKVVPLFITNAIDDLPLPIYGDGWQKRDYLCVHDHCTAIDLILHQGHIGEFYDVGTGSEIVNLDMARLILQLLSKPEALLRHVPNRPGRDWVYGLDIDKTRSLGWRARHTFEQTLERTVLWYVENEWWWRKIKSGPAFQTYVRQTYATPG